MFLNDLLIVARVDATHWVLVEDLNYEGARTTIHVPKGVLTDFASVPQFLQWLVPSTGTYTLAAVLHDYLCDSLNEHGYACVGDKFKLVSSNDVDGIFRRVMREYGVPPLRSWMMWTGVRWGALFNRRRRPGILSDLPAMILISVLALPIIMVPTVAVWVGTLLYMLGEKVAEWTGLG